MALKRKRVSFSRFKGRSKRFRRFGTFKRRALAPKRTGGFFSVRSRTIGAEKKTIDYYGVPTINSGTVNPFVINAVATGSDFTQRIGRRIRMKEILLRQKFAYSTATTPGVTCTVRMLVVLDKQYNAVATGAPVTTNAPQVALGTLDSNTVIAQNWINAPNNLNNRDRFSVLFDKFIDLQYYGTAVSSKKLYKKRLNIDVTFGGTTNEGGSIQTNAVLVYVFGDNAAAAGTNVASTYYYRIRFVDM